MAKNRRKVGPTVQERLGGMAAELRHIIYGEQGCPEWGTKFVQIEKDGMAVGLELARLLMEQSLSEQADQMPEEDLDCGNETGRHGSGGSRDVCRHRRVGRTGGLFESSPPGFFSLSERRWASESMRRSHRICRRS